MGANKLRTRLCRVTRMRRPVNHDLSGKYARDFAYVGIRVLWFEARELLVDASSEDTESASSFPRKKLSLACDA